MAAVIRAAVMKSACRSCKWIRSPGSRDGAARSIIAPFGTRPAVGWFTVWELLPPFATKPPVTTEPCAAAYTCPSAPFSGVSISMPPCRLLASPIADTVMSTRVPGCPNGGRSAVTSTAAVLRTRIAVGSTVTPMRASRLARLCAENTVCRLSPVPFNPTTSPYPTSWLSRTPSIETRSLSLVAAFTQQTDAAKTAINLFAPISLERKQPHQKPVKNEWPTHGIVHHAFSIDSNLQHRDAVRRNRIRRRQIVRANNPANRHLLPLRVDAHILVPFDHQISVRQHARHHRRHRRRQRTVAARRALS